MQHAAAGQAVSPPSNTRARRITSSRCSSPTLPARRPTPEELAEALKRADEATDRAWGEDNPNTPVSWASLGENNLGTPPIEIPAVLQVGPSRTPGTHTVFR